MHHNPQRESSRRRVVAAALVFALLVLVIGLGAVTPALATPTDPNQATADTIWRPLSGPVYISTATGGTVGGLAFDPADIIRYDPAAGWSMIFDASDVKVTRNVVAFEILDDGSIWLVFVSNQAIPGVGTFTPWDIARFVPTSLGPDTAGAFEWVLDGSAHSLTTSSEKIDAVARMGDGRIAISTAGAAIVVRTNAPKIRATDQDILTFDMSTNDWDLIFYGASVPGLAVEDVNGLWVDPDSGDFYINMVDSFNLGGLRGNGKDIVRLRWRGGDYRASLLFAGADYQLPGRIDAFELADGVPDGLSWPIGCVPGQTCNGAIGYPDINNDGKAFNCGRPGYTGHQGTDIGITWTQMDAHMPVYAAADGIVQWVFDGKYDRCPSTNPDCQGDGTVVCTDVGNYCWGGGCCCLWCFAGGNVVVIRHLGIPGVFATRYDHLKNGSILVKPGQYVSWGQKIAEAGSAGNSSGPHLHFEVWGTDYYKLAEPWAGDCGPNLGPSLWSYNPPWSTTPTTRAAAATDSLAPFYGPDDFIRRYETAVPQSLRTMCPALLWPAD